MTDDHSRQVPIAVVGLGAIMPGSTDLAGLWRNIVGGRDLITDVPAGRWLAQDHYDPDPTAQDKTYARRGAFLPEVDFDPMTFGVVPNNLPATDTTQLLALLVAEQVLADAGGDRLSEPDRDRVSVVLGASTLSLAGEMDFRLHRPVWLKALRDSGIPEPEAQAACDRIAEHRPPWREATFPGLLTNVVAGRVASHFDLHGSNYTADAACASSLAALSTAIAELALDRADLVIAGGVDTANEPLMFVCFSKTPALSPSGDCRPFSDRADGTMLGEGLAMFALKRLADAERDGDRIYAVIRGLGTSSDGGGTSIYAPVPAGQARALRRAYRQSGYQPDTVELVEAHGTGTMAGDAAEFGALREVFDGSGRSDRQWCGLGSAKSQFGHTKCAAGALGLLKAVLALHHRVLPPTIKVDRPDPRLDIEHSPFYLNTEARPWVRPTGHPRRASVSSFGFGGSNFHVTVQEYVPDEAGWGQRAWRSRSSPTELVLFGADSPETLLAAIRQVDPARPLADLARDSQQRFRATDRTRLAVVATDTQDLIGRLTRAAGLVEQATGDTITAPGLSYADGPPVPGRIGFLFPGQGSQYVGMGADLAMQLDRVQQTWDALGTRTFDDRALHQVVFPRPVFTDEDRERQRELLTATEWAQPALAVHSLALLDVLTGLGLRPDCVAGHSFGELTALHAAGSLGAGTLLDLARRRGELMRDAATTPGAMLAVSADRDRVVALLADRSDVWLANHNAPRQVVLSGAVAALDPIADKLAADGVTTKRLNTATAFHSPVVAAAGAPLLEFLAGIDVGPPGIPVYGNADGAPYPEEPAEIRRRIADHLASPVLFQDSVEAMYRAGVRTFVEVGPGGTLTGLVDQILADRDHLAVGLDRSGQHGMTGLHEALGRLAVHGVELDLTGLWEGYAPPATPPAQDGPRMAVRIDGGNYGRTYPPPGGAAEFPPPNPAATPPPPYPAEQLAAGYAAAGAARPDATEEYIVDADLIRVIEESNRQNAEALAACQRALSDSYLAYLRSWENSISALFGRPAPEQQLPAQPPAPPVIAQPAPAVSPMPAPPPVPDVSAPPPPEPAPVAQPVPGRAAEAPAESMTSRLAAMGDKEFEQFLLSVVADRTGYPVSLLNLDMDLETDLGIDSIKKVEILSVLQEDLRQLSRDELAELSGVRTLRQIGEKIGERLAPADPRPSSGDTAPAVAGDPRPPAPVSPGSGSAPPELTRQAFQAVPEPASGQPLPGLRAAALAVIEDGTGIARLVAEKLTAHGITADVVTEVPAGAGGVVLLGGLAGAAAVDEALAVQRQAFQAARTVAARFERAGGIFVTVQDTGGDFGLAGRTPGRAWFGGLAGLARTAGREWPRASVKAIDCERSGRSPEAVAETVVQELLTGGSTVDVALRAGGGRYTLRPVPAPRQPDSTIHIGPDSVIVASGGARGVTAAALTALAAAHRPRLVLLGRTPLVDEPAGLADAVDEAALIRVLSGRAGPGTAPAAITRQAHQILAVREIRSALAALEQAGSPARYLPVDVRDPAALASALDAVRADWGPVTGLVHGAGVLADKRLTDKTDEQFDRVFGTKVAGLRALLEVTADDPLRFIFLFSSVAGCFGNAGQSDYAMANETLNLVAVEQQAARPDCLVRSIAWGPWHGGMVTPALAGHFDQAGVALIPLERGAAAFVTELASAGDTRVVMAAGERDSLAGAPDSTGSAPVPAAGTPADPPATVELRVDSRSHPYLADHELAGVPVLPMAVVLDWFVGTAETWRAPTGGTVLRDLRVFDKVALPGLCNGGHRLVVRTRRSAGEGAQVELGLYTDDDRPRYRASLLQRSAAGPETWPTPAGLTPTTGGIYDGGSLFHGPRFRAIRSVDGMSDAGASGTLVGLGELGWGGDGWHVDPAAIDGGIQLAVLWAARTHGYRSLPMAIQECRIHRRGPLEAEIGCLVRARSAQDGRVRCDVALLDDGVPRVELLGVELVQRPD